MNILGLAIGMTVFLFIAQYVKFELSYENFIPGRDNIYRVSLTSYRNNDLISASAENYPAVGPAMKKDLPEVISYARLYNMGYKNNVVIKNENGRSGPIAFKIRKFLYADSSFLPMMGYEMEKGIARTALAEPMTAVISEKYARMYFGNEDPMGKTLHLHDDDSNDELATITGVFRDIPSNTHLKFDILFSYKTLFARGDKAPGRYDQSWVRADMYTLIQLKPGVNPKILEGKLLQMIDKYKPQLRLRHEKELLGLQPLSSIHLYSDLAEEPETNGNATIVFFINLIGIFVLIIAWINYINLSTARAITRSKEVGVRKVIGAFKPQLIIQFLVESALINLLSLFIAICLLIIFLPYFNSISGHSLNMSSLLKDWFIGLCFILWIIGSLLSGFYPAWVLSSFKPIVVLKGKLKGTATGVLLRKGLVVFQFMASVALIAGTIIVYSQLDYMMTQKLGVNINQILVTDRPGIAPNDNKERNAFNAQIDLFRNELKKHSDIEAASASATIPGFQRQFKTTIKNLASHSNDSIMVRINSMDYDFLKVFKMNLIAGRNFSREYPQDPDTSLIITETTSRLLGYARPQDAIGKILELPEFGGWKPIIVGVVNDYHQVSLRKPLEPFIFLCAPYDGEYYSVRINTSHLAQTIGSIEHTWQKAFPGNPFEYFFLDEYFNRQYSNEQKFEKLFTSFSILAILISCLGLFGLSAYMASQRIREIGIRKVLGASVLNISTMLSKDFLLLVLIAILIASPLGWIIMNNWLQQFAYRITIHWWIFLIAGLISVIIALITVSFQAFRAAVTNPVNSLRTE